MVGKYRVVTLCGSTRFRDAFMAAQKDLTLSGNIVISVGLFGHSGDSEVWENMDEGTLTKTKAMLDDMHKRKIDMADGIFVINVGGYIGSSTKSEIEYALATGKDVTYLEAPDCTIEKKGISNMLSLQEAIGMAHSIDGSVNSYTEFKNGWHFINNQDKISMSDPGFAISKTDGKVYHGFSAHQFLKGEIISEGTF
jgi:hypothetical protein